jgi:agmatine deiminase
MGQSPAELGYAMPAEWERHEATWLAWPKNPETFPAPTLAKVEQTYARLADALSASEEVRILVDDQKAESRVKSKIRAGGHVTFHRIKTADVWVRDYGPTYLRGKGVALVKWTFNAWGNKYDDLMPDDESGERIAASTGLRVFRPGIVLEGGSVDVNGMGSLLTTEQCLLNSNRNPRLGRASLEEVLRDYLGVSNVVWLGEGIEGDDTDGHVDDIARFVGGRKVVVGEEESRSDPNHRALEQARRVLEEAEDQDGHGFEVVALPMPRRVDSPFGRLPASHLNFYIGNGVVLVPTFGGESDRTAVEVLEGLFPGREATGVDCRALVHGLGTIHCVTQQVPAQLPVG